MCQLQDFYLTLFVIGVFIGVATILLNGTFILTTLLVGKLRSLRIKLLMLLAVADLMQGLFSWSTYLLNVYYIHIQGDAPANIHDSHIISGYCLACFAISANWVIGFEQYLAIAYPYKHQKIMNAKVTIIPVVAVNVTLWAVVIFLHSEYYDGPYDYFLSAMVALMFLIVLSLIFFFYLNIWRISRKVQQQIQSQNREEGARIAKEAKAAKTSFLVVMIFVVCYAPKIATEIFTIEGMTSLTMVCINYVFGMLALTKSLCNPCVYYWRLKQVRQSTKLLLQKCDCLQNDLQSEGQENTEDSIY